MDDKDRTIRIQQNMLELYEKEKLKVVDTSSAAAFDPKSIETANCATQTDRVSLKIIKEKFNLFYFFIVNFKVRPMSMGQDVFTRYENAIELN